MARADLGRTRAFERGLLRRFDRVLVTSPAEAAAFAELDASSARERVAVIPNGVDLEVLSAEAGRGRSRHHRLLWKAELSRQRRRRALARTAHHAAGLEKAARCDARPRRKGPGAGARVARTRSAREAHGFSRRPASGVRPGNRGRRAHGVRRRHPEQAARGHGVGCAGGGQLRRGLVASVAVRARSPPGRRHGTRLRRRSWRRWTIARFANVSAGPGGPMWKPIMTGSGWAHS